MTSRHAPSFTLQITKKDAEQFQSACRTVNDCLKNKSNTIYNVVQQCDDPLIVHFRCRIQHLEAVEIKAAGLLFQDLDKGSKLRNLFGVLSSTGVLTRQELSSLFRTILVAVSSCLGTQNPSVIVEGKPTHSPERPTKKPKLEDSIHNLHSFDSSMGTLKDEDETTSTKKEIEDVVLYVSDSCMSFVHAQGKQGVDFISFSNWYNQTGVKIAPWIELWNISKWKTPKTSSHSELHQHVTDESSPGSITAEDDPSRTMVSFDFNGSGSPDPLFITISEDNIRALKTLVHRTTLVNRPAHEICKLLLNHANSRMHNNQELLILQKQEFRRVIRTIIPEYVYAQLSDQEKDAFGESFFDFFSCFENAKNCLQEDEVDLKEFAVGFSFFCAGNKSAKLAAGFDLLDSKHRGYLTEDQLLRYLQSYLTMLVGMSLLVPVKMRKRRRPLTPDARKKLRLALESGARWTLGHFLKASNSSKNEYTFDSFATWYSSGGYNVAPWLELLDLTKIMSLIAETSSPIHLPPLETRRDRVSSLRRHHQGRRGPPPEVLFTFPLGGRRSLVVLREDAVYVRSVVEQLGLLSLTPEDLWTGLSRSVEKRQKTTRTEVAVYVSMRTFVSAMVEVCPVSRKRSNSGSTSKTSSSNEELLSNFYQCFDIEQCDSVALDELMGGLTLLCGGKKSHKLSFAFSIFDTRPGATAKKRVAHSLSGEDLFLFLRSILIVTFSTCRQSLDLTDEMVGRCIADTANMICNDVMRHQWETKRTDRLDFDEFGQWYNDGGYERAPWLELLDLKKWVMQDAKPPPPSPPPEDSVDNSFFDTDVIMPIDSMDEMDMMLKNPSYDKDDFPGISRSFSYSPKQQQLHHPPKQPAGNPLKFHLNTTDSHGGFALSLSQARIRHFRQVLEASGLQRISAEAACNKILARGRNTIKVNDYQSAVSEMLEPRTNDRQSERVIHDLFSGIFAAFDRNNNGEAKTFEVACGLTVLCKGKKSDKLEFAFEVLNKEKRGRLTQSDMTCYLQSFLTVLLSIAFSPSLTNDSVDDGLTTNSGQHVDRTTSTLIRAAKDGADWAASLAFRDNRKESMSFDDFADWYTAVGYSSIPWLELLDLQKWAMMAEKK